MKIEKFRDRLIAFDPDNEMVNATDMLKAFPKKRMNDFLKLKSTKEFIKELESDNEKSRIQALTIVIGQFSDGRAQGTWMHRLLAYKFASWLDVKFELFVYSVFDSVIQEKLLWQQRQLDYFWDKEDIKDTYNKKL